jgi:hypothetical protein
LSVLASNFQSVSKGNTPSVRDKGETGVNQGRWQFAEETAVHGVNDESFPQGWPITIDHAS